jgi:hypothetical protein
MRYMRIRITFLLALSLCVIAVLLWRAFSVRESFDAALEDAAFKERMRMLEQERDDVTRSSSDYLSDPGPLSDAYTIMASFSS